MARRIIGFTILIIGISLIINLSRDILKLLKAGNRIKLAEQKVSQLEKEQKEILEKHQYYQSNIFILINCWSDDYRVSTNIIYY